MDPDIHFEFEASQPLLLGITSRIATSETNSHLPLNSNPRSGEVISKIEDIFDSIVDCIQNRGKELTIPIKTRAKTGLQASDASSGAIGSLSDGKIKNISFPSRNPQEAWRFSRSSATCMRLHSHLLLAAFLRVLELSHEALVHGGITTKRSFSLTSTIQARRSSTV